MKTIAEDCRKNLLVDRYNAKAEAYEECADHLELEWTDDKLERMQGQKVQIELRRKALACRRNAKAISQAVREATQHKGDVVSEQEACSYDDDEDYSDSRGCCDCGGRGWVVRCIDDLCHGQDECIHGRPPEPCWNCNRDRKKEDWY